MRVCFVLPDNIIAGGVFAVYALALRLHKKGHSITIAFARDLTSLEVTSYPGMEALEVIRLTDLADQKRSFDFVFATWWETAYELAKLNAKHYCYFVQARECGFYPETSHWPVFVERTLVEPFHYFASTGYLQRWLKENYGHEAALVACGVDLERFRSARPIVPKSGRVRILVEGATEYPIKNVPFTFEVLDAFPDVEKVLLTPGGQIEELWHVDHVFRAMPYDRVAEIYASCDILLKLSTQESFALPVLEMFATGGTAVVAEFDGMAEYIKHEENSLVVCQNDIESARRALRRLIDDEELRRRLSESAFKTAASRSWDGSAAALELRLTEILNEDLDRSRKNEETREINEDTSCCRRPLVQESLYFQAAVSQRIALEKSTNQLVEQSRQMSNEIASLSDEMVRLKADITKREDELSQIKQSESFKLGNALVKPVRALLDTMGRN